MKASDYEYRSVLNMDATKIMAVVLQEACTNVTDVQFVTCYLDFFQM